MPRTIEVTVPSDQTEDLLREIESLCGVIGVRLSRGASRQPPGDVISVDILTSCSHDLLKCLVSRGIAAGSLSSVKTSEPDSIAANPWMKRIAADESEASWEEMEFALGKEGNMTRNGMVLMFLSGILAAVGISTGALHIVIGAMIIAPGFEPIVRVALGVVVRGIAWRRGLVDAMKAYGAMVLGAAAGVELLILAGIAPVGGNGSYLPPESLFVYWSDLTLSSMLIALSAAVAGAVVIMANRSVLTAGVMVVMALVPSATITGMALVLGEWALAGASFRRWIVEVIIVFFCSLAVFAWRRSRKGRGFLLTSPPAKTQSKEAFRCPTERPGRDRF